MYPNPEVRRKSRQEQEQDKRVGFAIGILDDLALAGVSIGWSSLTNKFAGNKTPPPSSGTTAHILSRDIVKAETKIPKVTEEVAKMGTFGSFFKRGSVTALLGVSIMTGGAGIAHADDVVKVHSKISTVEKFAQLQSLVNSVTSPSEVNMKRLLMETSIHESGYLKHSRQLGYSKKWSAKKQKMITVLEENSVARSIFMVEPTTAKYLVTWAKNKPQAKSLLTTVTGRSYSQLAQLNRQQLADMIMENDRLGAVMAKLKYQSVARPVPATMEERAAFWGKYYQGTSDPKKISQYKSNVKMMSEELKATQLAKVARRQLSQTKNTVGLVNDVLHNKKIRHNIASQALKIITHE